MPDRIRFITHQGKQVLLVDLAHCSAEEVEKTLRKVPDVVTARPRSSVLIMSDFTAATFDADALLAMKETAVFDKPYIKKTAWVGTDSFPNDLSQSVSDFSHRQFPAFKSRQEALDWLVRD
jgi:hypothetical protein